ncbi:MFS-type transporter SLC18B1-like protein, partial [Leptotrombidium deliense]
LKKCEEQYPKETEEFEKLTYKKLISIPKVNVAIMALFTMGISLASVAAVLELYLMHYNVGPEFVGYIFIFSTAPFAVVSLIVGNLLTNINHFKCMAFGLSLCALGYLFIAPSPLFFLNGNIMIVIVALCFIDSGNALTYIPSLPSIMKIIKTIGYTEN